MFTKMNQLFFSIPFHTSHAIPVNAFATNFTHIYSVSAMTERAITCKCMYASMGAPLSKRCKLFKIFIFNYALNTVFRQFYLSSFVLQIVFYEFC